MWCRQGIFSRAPLVFLVYLVGLEPNERAETIDGLTENKSLNERDICTKFITPPLSIREMESYTEL